MLASKRPAKDARLESSTMTVEVEIVDGESVTRYAIPGLRDAFIKEFNKLTEGAGKYARLPAQQ